MKAPAFQFYASDFLASVADMSAEEVGAYILALSWSWNNGPLPADVVRVSRLMRVDVDVVRVVLNRWELTESGYVNRRLESEREKQAEFRAQQAERGKIGAAKRWPKDGQRHSGGYSGGHAAAIAQAMPEDSSPSPSPSPILEIPKERVSLALCAEPSTDDSAPAVPALLSFPIVGKGPKVWHLTADYVAELAGDYPGLDVFGECRKAHAWCKANLNRRKTAKGMPAFLVSWLNRAANSGRGQTVTTYAAKPTTGQRLAQVYDDVLAMHGVRLAEEVPPDGRVEAPRGLRRIGGGA